MGFYGIAAVSTMSFFTAALLPVDTLLFLEVSPEICIEPGLQVRVSILSLHQARRHRRCAQRLVCRFRIRLVQVDTYYIAMVGSLGLVVVSPSR